MKKLLILVILINLISVNVYAEEFVNNYIDIEEPKVLVEEYENYTKNITYNDFYFNTDSEGNVTTASINDTTYSSVNAGYITSVKNQMSTGSCWAHAGMSVLETAAIKSGNATTSLNLSEMHLVYGTHANAFSDKEMKNRFYLGGPLNSTNNGGNIIMTASYLYSGLGAVKDSLFPLKSYSSYGSGEVKPVNSSGKEVQITTEQFATIDSTPEFYVNDFYRSYGTRGSCNKSVNDIKKMILNYGSVQISVDWQNANVHNSYYFVNTSSTSTNHAVTLVGWDDSIEASKFGFEDTSKTGGWIMKNSWGTGKGNKGYYYISYYDNTVCGSASTFSGIDTNNYDHVYDSSGMYYSSTLYNLKNQNVYQASIFENEGISENLEKVSFAVNPGYTYNVYYALYDNGNWKTNSSSWIKLGTLNGSSISYYGIKSLNVSSANVKITDKYVIIIKGTKPNTSSTNNAIITYKDKTYTKNSISTVKMELVDDTNYYSVDGSNWEDLAHYYYTFQVECQNNEQTNCYYSSAFQYDGAQNVIYAYTIEDIQIENSIDATIVDSNGLSVSNFYSFDDSKFKIDYSNLKTSIESFYPLITNSNNEDLTSKFSISVNDSNKEILITNNYGEYIPVGTYSLTLYFDLNNTGLFEYRIKSNLTVTKPFYVDSLSVSTEDGKIYTDTEFNVLLGNYANTLKNSYLTYLIKKDNNDVTNSFNINYSNGKVTVKPKSEVSDGNYKLFISINGNDSEVVNFTVYKSYTINYNPDSTNLVLTPNTNTHTYTVDELDKNISSVYGYSILNSNNEVINPSIIGTGMKLKINTSSNSSTTYTFVVVGDLSGDGKISTADYVRLWNHLDRSNSYTINDPSILKAADISLDSKLSTSDYVKLWNQLKRG